jgi:hypothetical protein
MINTKKYLKYSLLSLFALVLVVTSIYNTLPIVEATTINISNTTYDISEVTKRFDEKLFERENTRIRENQRSSLKQENRQIIFKKIPDRTIKRQAFLESFRVTFLENVRDDVELVKNIDRTKPRLEEIFKSNTNLDWDSIDGFRRNQVMNPNNRVSIDRYNRGITNLDVRSKE